jgi:long-chain fatty acid transport protein
MGGASTAAPVDATGALFWNPATTSALPGSSIDFSVELLYPHTRLSSSVPASAFGPGIPPIPLAGSNDGDDGVFPLPTMGLVYRPDDSRLTYGLGVFPIAGFGVNYPSSLSNPILMPQPPNGLGLGSIYSNLQVVQIAPTIAYALSNNFSIGAGPTLNLASLRVDPLFVASPNANGAYATGTHTRETWGSGFQVGVYYALSCAWQVGASFKSPQWFDDFRFQTVDERGRPRFATFSADLPMITSLGVAYSGIDRLLLAADFRYVDFENADGFKQKGFDATGAVRGVGWDSVFALSLGAQYQLTDSLAVRLGYSYNDNPIPDAQSSVNVGSPTIVEHTLYVGGSYQLSPALTLSLAYAHGFENTISGPLQTPFGAIPGSAVKNTTSADLVALQVSVKFGCHGMAN